MKKSVKIILVAVLSFAAVCVLVAAAANIAVVSATKAGIIPLEESGNFHDVDLILVLGCGVKPDGSPSDMLRDRLAQACEVYRLTGGAKILVSGDGAREGYDEITPMIKYCLDHGVNEDDILCDRYGISTFESVKRAKHEFGAEKLLIITQEYHLYRALYIAERFGVDGHGVAADLHTYAGQKFRDMREIPARTKDFLITLIIK